MLAIFSDTSYRLFLVDSFINPMNLLFHTALAVSLTAPATSAVTFIAVLNLSLADLYVSDQDPSIEISL